jgi:hypothetical protein
MAVLGGILLRNEALNHVSDLLSPEDFYLPAHQEIYRAMQSLADRRAPIDPITIEAELQTRGSLAMSGGLVYLGEVQARVPTAENIEYYARHVYDLSTLRRLIQSWASSSTARRRPCSTSRSAPRGRRTATSSRSCARCSTTWARAWTEAASWSACRRASPTSTGSPAACSPPSW